MLIFKFDDAFERRFDRVFLMSYGVKLSATKAYRNDEEAHTQPTVQVVTDFNLAIFRPDDDNHGITINPVLI